ncbi:hypothetical protein OH76DRAFT_332446 [Lentinus brumalis]|uniref:Uncharacterized protein n=1 Tax=Lentinus brumalis TaxID=2498619 RepID=A0A371DFT2_9APHY|nr:hypothetical protein OH76DRAFT_332446 [Polyporus brumalis]
MLAARFARCRLGFRPAAGRADGWVLTEVGCILRWEWVPRATQRTNHAVSRCSIRGQWPAQASIIFCAVSATLGCGQRRYIMFAMHTLRCVRSFCYYQFVNVASDSRRNEHASGQDGHGSPLRIPIAQGKSKLEAWDTVRPRVCMHVRLAPELRCIRRLH